MYCPYCGRQIADGSRFCQSCGKAIAGYPSSGSTPSFNVSSPDLPSLSGMPPAMPQAQPYATTRPAHASSSSHVASPVPGASTIPGASPFPQVYQRQQPQPKQGKVLAVLLFITVFLNWVMSYTGGLIMNLPNPLSIFVVVALLTLPLALVFLLAGIKDISLSKTLTPSGKKSSYRVFSGVGKIILGVCVVFTMVMADMQYTMSFSAATIDLGFLATLGNVRSFLALASSLLIIIAGVIKKSVGVVKGPLMAAGILYLMNNIISFCFSLLNVTQNLFVALVLEGGMSSVEFSSILTLIFMPLGLLYLMGTILLGVDMLTRQKPASASHYQMPVPLYRP